MLSMEAHNTQTRIRGRRGKDWLEHVSFSSGSSGSRVEPHCVPVISPSYTDARSDWPWATDPQEFLKLFFLFQFQELQEPQVTMQTWTMPGATPHTASPPNGTETTSRNSVPRIQILRNMLFAKKHKKDPKKDTGKQCEGNGCRCWDHWGPCKV